MVDLAFPALLAKIKEAVKLADEQGFAPNTETEAMRAAAWEALDAECEQLENGAWQAIHPSSLADRWPVVPKEALPALQAEWRRNPGLRACIRIAADIGPPERRDASLLLRALWEMGLSWEWRREAGGMLPFEWGEDWEFER